MAEPLAKDKHFHSYAWALLRHHYLLEQGKEGTPDFDEVEEFMSWLWKKLNEEQRRELRGISSDLNWMRRGYQPAPKGRRKEDVTKADLERFQRSMDSLEKDLQAKELWPLLHALRDCAPALENGLVAIGRARAYLSVGLREVSAPFLKATVDLSPDRSDAARSAFVMLIHVSPAGAFQKATEVLEAPDRYPPVVVAFAVQFFVDFLGGDPAVVSRDGLAEMLRKAALRLDDEPTLHEDRVLFYSLVGANLMSFGFVDDGIRFLEEGLKLEPDNADLLGWLGEAVYDRDRERAVDLFRRSIFGRTRLIRPYLHLANHFLIERDFGRAKAYAAHAAENARDNFSLAAALEIIAISMSEEGAPSNIVLGLFRRAVQLAPSNKRIAQNLAAYHQFTHSQSARTFWETGEPSEIHESRERWRAEAKDLVAVSS